MGMFDVVRNDEGFEGQIKVWGRRMDLFVIGDRVPDVNGFSTYAVAMREGGYVTVVDNIIESWNSALPIEPLFDKWGRECTPGAAYKD